MPNQDSNLPLVGGMVAAIGAGLCCAGPLVLLLLGISGSWISNLTLLEPYRPLFIIAVLMAFGYAGWQIHRPIEQCQEDSVCAVPQTRKRRQMIFWPTVVLAIVLVTSNYWIIWFA
ncbi:mercury transporter [Candidatus Aerophobetes bacterium]|uniref:Mercuric transport protein MerT n=1 Tax=Aerophobetes bacterium TaxID=2030807 RepID=A0A2A4YAN7_UNCAE|nr:MAG: mercury transporter [Candidatus Aerophobetes bacterium]